MRPLVHLLLGAVVGAALAIVWCRSSVGHRPVARPSTEGRRSAHDRLEVLASTKIAPSLSREAVRLLGSMASPEGTYAVDAPDEPGPPWRDTYSITNCREQQERGHVSEVAPFFIWVGVPALRCDLRIVSTRVDEPRCAATPRPDWCTSSLPAEEVVFVRSTSPVAGHDGEPDYDRWFTLFPRLHRWVRVIITRDRFVVQQWNLDDPQILIAESPIVRGTDQ